MEYKVRPGVQSYFNETGLLEKLDQFLLDLGLERVLCVIDPGGFYSVESYLPKRFEAVEATFTEFNGECSFEEGDRLTELAKEHNVDAIVGIGGGKTMDVIKLVANKIDIDFVQIPTIAATCAAWAPLSVVYTEDGEYIDFYEFTRCARAVIVDPRVLIKADAKFFLAGLTDTLAKWYEGSIQLESMERTPNLELGYQAMKICYDFIMKDAKEALEAIYTQRINQSFVNLLDVIFATAGSVGGYADYYGRQAGAHAVHNGLTHLPEVKEFLHGTLVGYGILVQLALEEKWADVDEVLALYNDLDLPCRLADFNLSIDHPDLNKAIEVMCLDHSPMHFVRDNITHEEVFNAMKQLEDYLDQKAK
ncbi:iron-containing alcohol dehydrogenase family protein [Dolosicoccus paucivorans]|uniref:iron-containing alcohol dehydrogenase family protein n=1 Tax=Dolosicoccus paucivorans TaxID=84521 RepID=UPI0008852E57|nr:iron-containing alcohol dehydrogenase family protein [Dolosicoccus paucivorans]SDI53018.1 uncharacterized oxidoreductase [Dolosicoccus paucivorans]